MKAMEEKISKYGKLIGKDIVKVDMFLNHQLDIDFLNEMGAEFARVFADKGINKILTVEASGIAIAYGTALSMKVPVVFAKKGYTSNIGDNLYSAKVHSFTKNRDYIVSVSKDYLNESDRVLILDDFLANGQAALGLVNIVRQAGAKAYGIGIAVEKGFQDGGKLLRATGIPVHSLAIIDAINEDGTIIYGNNY